MTFTFPEVPATVDFEGKPSTTFSIPREYVRFSGVLSRKVSAAWQPYTVPIVVKLPNPKSAKNGKSKGVRETPEAKERSENSSGWYTVRIGAGSAVGGRARLMDKLRAIGNQQDRPKTMVADGEVYGLLRYSPVRCYGRRDLKNEQLARFLSEKASDDPVREPNCRVDRAWSEYFSRLTEEVVDDVIYVLCMSTGCHLYFSVERVSASVYLPHDELEFWQRIVNPSRDLLRTFIIRDETQR